MDNLREKTKGSNLETFANPAGSAVACSIVDGTVHELNFMSNNMPGAKLALDG